MGHHSLHQSEFQAQCSQSKLRFPFCPPKWLGWLNRLRNHLFPVYSYPDVLATALLDACAQGFWLGVALKVQMPSFGPHLGTPLFEESSCDREGLATWEVPQHFLWRHFLYLPHCVRAQCAPETTQSSPLLRVVFGEQPDEYGHSGGLLIIRGHWCHAEFRFMFSKWQQH